MMFIDWPRHWRSVRGEQAAIRLDQQTLSWRELCARVDALASGFARQGVKEGDGVMLRARNHPHTLLAPAGVIAVRRTGVAGQPSTSRSLADRAVTAINTAVYAGH